MSWNKSGFLLLGFFLVFFGTALRADDVANVFLKSVSGDVVIRSLGEPDWHAPQQGMALEETTEIRLGPEAQALIWLDKDELAGKVSMADKGVFRFALVRRDNGERKTVVELGQGTLTVQGDTRQKTSGLEVQTPTGRVAVKDAAMRFTVQ
jgi:hypothetical protein